MRTLPEADGVQIGAGIETFEPWLQLLEKIIDKSLLEQFAHDIPPSGINSTRRVSRTC